MTKRHLTQFIMVLLIVTGCNESSTHSNEPSSGKVAGDLPEVQNGQSPETDGNSDWGSLQEKWSSEIEVLLKSENHKDQQRGLSKLQMLQGNTKHLHPHIVNLADSPHDDVRRAAIPAIGASADDPLEYLDLFIGCLQDPVSDIRLAAVKTLGSIGPPAKPALPALGELLGDLGLQVSDFTALAIRDIDPEYLLAQVPTQLELLVSEDPAKRARAAKALASIGPQPARAQYNPMADALTPRFHAPQAGIQIKGGFGSQELRMGKVANAPLDSRVLEIVPALHQQLKREPDPEAKKYILWALADFEHHATVAVADIRLALNDPREKVRTFAGIALDSIGESSITSVPSMVYALRSPDPQVRMMTARAMRRMEDDLSDAIPVLVEMVRNDSMDVAVVAATTLAHISGWTDDNIDVLVGRIAQSRFIVPGYNTPGEEKLVMVLDIAGPAAIVAVPMLVKLARDNEESQMFLLPTLVHLDETGKDAIPLLIEVAMGSNSTTSVQACNGLGQYPDMPPQAINTLLAATKGKKLLTMAAAIAALGSVKNPGHKVINALIGLLSLEIKMEGDYHKYCAAISLIKIGKADSKYAQQIQKALANEKQPNNKYHTVINAKLIEDKAKTREMMLSVIDCDANLMGIILDELAVQGPVSAAAIPVLQQLLDGPDIGNRFYLISAMCRIDPHSIDNQVPYLRDWLIKGETDQINTTAWLLGEIGSGEEDVIEWLELLLYSRSMETRTFAAQAIHKIQAAN